MKNARSNFREKVRPRILYGLGTGEGSVRACVIENQNRRELTGRGHVKFRSPSRQHEPRHMHSELEEHKELPHNFPQSDQSQMKDIKSHTTHDRCCEVRSEAADTITVVYMKLSPWTSKVFCKKWCVSLARVDEMFNMTPTFSIRMHARNCA